MSIYPISWPQANINSNMDFTQLGKLGDVYSQARDEAKRRATLSGLTGDPKTDSLSLMQSGDLPLAQLGLTSQNQEITRNREDARFKITDANEATRLRYAGNQDARAGAAAGREQEKYEQDSPEWRRKNIVAIGLDPNDPNYAAHIATGTPLPNALALEKERREKIKFAEEEKLLTMEGRRQRANDTNMDINDPGVRRWIATGAEMPDPTVTNRLGVGAPLYTQNMETGEIQAHQLSASKPFEVPPGHRLLGPGEMAAARAQGTATGKATGAAITTLPDVARHTEELVGNIDKLLSHESKDVSLGRGSQLPEWMVAGTGIADFRERVKQLSGEAMQQTMASLKGAGLGSVSDFEQKNLMTAFVRASTAQSVKEFNQAMSDAKKSAEKIREIARAKAKGDFSEHPSKPAPGTRPPLGAIFGQ